MKLKVICNAEDRVLMSYSFLAVSVMLEPAMHRITSLEILGTLIAGLQQNKQINRFEATFAENLLFSERRLIKMQF